jgi:hypothetical protein
LQPTVIAANGDVERASIAANGDVERVSIAANSDVVRVSIAANGDVERASIVANGDVVRVSIAANSDVVRVSIAANGDVERDAGGTCCNEHRIDAPNEPEVTEGVDGKVLLVAIGCDGQRHQHDGSVAHENIDGWTPLIVPLIVTRARMCRLCVRVPTQV